MTEKRKYSPEVLEAVRDFMQDCVEVTVNTPGEVTATLDDNTWGVLRDMLGVKLTVDGDSVQDAVAAEREAIALWLDQREEHHRSYSSAHNDYFAGVANEDKGVASDIRAGKHLKGGL